MSRFSFLKFMLINIKRRMFDDICSTYKLQKRFPSLTIETEVQIKSSDRLFLGENVVIQKGAILHCGGMDWSNYAGGIAVGDNVYIGPYCILFGAGGIKIGNDVLLGPKVVITSHQHTFVNANELIREQPTEFCKVVIEDDVWIGSGALILPGVRIGKGTVIGAGAVVNESVPRRSIAVGVPARVVKERS